MKQMEEEIKQILLKYFNTIYFQEYTTDWKTQRFIRELEICVMGDNILSLFTHQQDELREKVNWIKKYKPMGVLTNMDYVNLDDVLKLLNEDHITDPSKMV